MDHLRWRWRLLRRAVLRKWLQFRYRNQDGNICGCGDDLDRAHPGVTCSGHCRSLKDYVIETEIDRRIP